MESQYDFARKSPFSRERFDAFQAGRFGSRYTEYRKEWTDPFDPPRVPDFPLYVIIETAYRCNFACVTCVHGARCTDIKAELDTRFTRDIMPEEVFAAFLEQARTHRLPSVCFNWLGEPTLAKDIDQRIRRCAEAGIMDIIMSSNGTFMNEDLARRILGSGLTHMLFSLDAATEETYRKIRVNGNFRLVNENIARFVRLRNELNGGLYPMVRASLVPSRENEAEISRFVETYSRLVDFAEVQPLVDTCGRLGDLLPQGVEPAPFRCLEVFKTMTVDVMGDIHPCCALYARNMVLGNVRTHDLRDVFHNHPLLREIREDVVAGNYRHPECQECQRTNYKLTEDVVAAVAAAREAGS